MSEQTFFFSYIMHGFRFYTKISPLLRGIALRLHNAATKTAKQWQ